MAVKKAPVAALGAYLALTDVLAYLLVGWWAAILGLLFWGGVAGASIRAERTLTAKVGKAQRVPCSDRACASEHTPGGRCRCHCRSARCGEIITPAGRPRRR